MHLPPTESSPASASCTLLEDAALPSAVMPDAQPQPEPEQTAPVLPQGDHLNIGDYETIMLGQDPVVQRAFAQVQQQHRFQAQATTWFLNHESYRRCPWPRTVGLSSNPSQWMAALKQTWNDVWDRSVPCRISVVKPDPPFMLPNVVQPTIHMIIEQSWSIAWIGVLISIVQVPRQFDVHPQLAVVVRAWSTARDLHRHAEVQSICQNNPSMACHTLADGVKKPNDQANDLRSGLGIVIEIKPAGTGDEWTGLFQQPGTLKVTSAESQVLTGLPLPPTKLSMPEPDSPLLWTDDDDVSQAPWSQDPGMHLPIPTLHELLQDPQLRAIHEAWAGEAASAQDDESHVAVFFTFFISHRGVPRCDQGRLLELNSQVEFWEDMMIEAWADMVDRAFPVEPFLVDPPPNYSPNLRVAGFVILIQHPDPLHRGILHTIERAGFVPIHSALSAPVQLPCEGLLQFQGLDPVCMQDSSPFRCETIYDGTVMGMGDVMHTGDGLGITTMLLESMSSSSDPMVVNRVSNHPRVPSVWESARWHVDHPTTHPNRSVDAAATSTDFPPSQIQ